MLDYIRDGAAIYDKSFAMIRTEADLSEVPVDLEKLVVRLIHSCGITDIVNDIEASPNAGTIGRDALANGAPILCDANMVANGVTRSRLSANNREGAVSMEAARDMVRFGLTHVAIFGFQIQWKG